MTDKPTKKNDKATEVNDEKLSFEAARDELAEVVAKLESTGNSLEESLALWERGEKLVAICQQWLGNAKERIEKVRAAE